MNKSLYFLSLTCLSLTISTAWATCTSSNTRTNTSDNRISLLSSNADECLVNTGTITVNLFDAINSISGRTTIINSGTLTVSGAGWSGIFSSGLNASINNSGKITTDTISSTGIYSSGTNVYVINTGEITTKNGNFSHGIAAYGINAVIINNGLITTSGVDSYGIHSTGADSSITNAGTIRVTTSGQAIQVEGARATVTLAHGSVIEGSITTTQTDSVLNLNLGAGASYAFRPTGSWTINNLDGRPMVLGSAYAAGIGAQESAAHMLYQRSAPVTRSIDHRLSAFARDDAPVQAQWVDLYGAHINRQAGDSGSQRTAFSNNTVGLTAGLRLPFEGTTLEAVANIENSYLNIDTGSQKIDTNSVMLGLIAPQLTRIGDATLSAKALVGYGDHEGKRRVLNNTVSGGMEQVRSDFGSSYATLGAALTRHHLLSPRLQASSLMGIDLQWQHTGSYSETAYFAWDSRSLTQVHSRMKIHLDYALENPANSLFAGAELAQRTLTGGATQSYRINSTAVSYRAPRDNDLYLMLQVGARRLLSPGVYLMGWIGSQHSLDRISGVQASVRVVADL